MSHASTNEQIKYKFLVDLFNLFMDELQDNFAGMLSEHNIRFEYALILNLLSIKRIIDIGHALLDLN